jgi:hypothetical protein
MIKVDPEVTKLRKEVAAKRAELEAAAEALRVQTVDLDALPDALALEKERKEAAQKATDARNDFKNLRKAADDARTDHERANDDLQGAKTALAVLTTLVDISDMKRGFVPALFGMRAPAGTKAAGVDPRYQELLKGLKEEAKEAEKAVTERERAVQKTAQALEDARGKEAAAEAAWRSADAANERATEREQHRTDVDNEKKRRITAETQIAKDLDDLVEKLAKRRSGSSLLERFPSRAPDYLRITVSTTPIEAPAEIALRQLAISEPAFQPYEHVDKLGKLVRDLGINGDLIAIVDQLNRVKDKPVKRRILAATYPFTLLTLLESIRADVKDDHQLRDVIRDRVGFTNLIRDFQRKGLGKIAAPQQLFAEKFLEEVSERQQLNLPKKGPAKDELRERVLTNL